MNLVVIGILLLVVLYFYRSFQSFVYFTCILDIFFRIITFIKNNINVRELVILLEKYIPESIPTLIRYYTEDVITDLLMWVYVGIFIAFLFYVIKTFIKKRR